MQEQSFFPLAHVVREGGLGRCTITSSKCGDTAQDLSPAKITRPHRCTWPWAVTEQRINQALIPETEGMSPLAHVPTSSTLAPFEGRRQQDVVTSTHVEGKDVAQLRPMGPHDVTLDEMPCPGQFCDGATAQGIEQHGANCWFGG